MALYVSRLIDRPVVAPSGKRLGLVRDVVVGVEAHDYPVVRGFVVRTPARKALVLVPACQVTELAPSVRLRCEDLLLARVADGVDDVLVWRDLVDRLAIDARHARVGIVFDVGLRPVAGELSLACVDMSAPGLLRRLSRRMRAPGEGEACLDWREVVPAASWSFRLPAHRARLARLSALPPASIVRMINALTYRQAGEVLKALAPGRAAEAVALIVPDHRIAVLRSMSAASVVDILRELPASMVDRVLGALPARQVAELLMEDAGLAISVREPADRRR